MSSIVIAGDTSGSVTLQAPAVAGATILTLPATSGTVQTSGSGYTTNGVAFASSTSALATGSALTFDGTNLVSPTFQATAFNAFKTNSNSGQYYHFDNATGNNFMGLTAANRISIYAGGAENVNFTSTSLYTASGINVGIGTSSPVAKLHIGVADASADGTKGVRINNPAGTTVVLECGVSSDSFVGTTSGSLFNIRTQNVVRATFDTSGNFMVGTTSTQNGVISVFCNDNTRNCITTKVNSDGNNAVGFFNAGGSQVGSITTNSSTVSYNTSSDYRLKNTIAPMTGALAKVALLKPVTYKWNADGSDGQGFIAHELAEVCPDAVSGAKDAVDEDGNIKPQGIDTSFLVATLTAAIQELKTEFDAYKASHP
jgi:hypothetical protein